MVNQLESPETHSISALKAKKHIGSSKLILSSRWALPADLFAVGKISFLHRTGPARQVPRQSVALPPTPALVPEDPCSL